MHHWICVTCGTQYPATAAPPASCPICLDERQYVGFEGQQWLTDLAHTHTNRIFEEGPGVWGIHTNPKFAIGQRALLIQHPEGNVLWDCVSLLDQPTIDRVYELGGLSAMAVSHPHYYSAMVDWARVFGVPVYLHELDREHVQRPDPLLRFWGGEQHRLNDWARLLRLGGHFAGYQVLHDAQRGALFAGDLPQVCADREHVSFMYSYPNYLPLSAGTVERIAATLESWEFDTLYGAWPGFVIRPEAHRVVQHSARRYLTALETER